MKEIDEELKGGQKKLDVAEPKGKITAADFAALRAKKGVKKENSQLEEKVDMKELESELKRLKQENPGKKVTYDFITDPKFPKGYVIYIDGKIPNNEGELKLGVKYDYKGESGFISTGGSNDPRNWKFLSGKKPDQYPYLAVKADLVPSKKQPGKYDGAFDMGRGKGHHIDENEDHEVSMAHNSLESIIRSAMELKGKLGDDEKDIPAWIQDHITNAENYINQASKNYHEYSNGEHDFDELPDGTVEVPVGDEEDAEMSLQGLMEAVKGKKKRK